MKKIIFVAIILLSSKTISQETGEPLIYSSVVSVDSSKTANQLYVLTRSWFAEKFNSAQDVIQFDDKDEGKIIAKARFPYMSKALVYSNATKGFISFTITVSFKDGRYKYEVTNFNHTGNPNNNPLAGPVNFGLITSDQECPYPISTKSWRNKTWKELKLVIDNNVQPIIKSLSNYIALGVVKKNDW